MNTLRIKKGPLAMVLALCLLIGLLAGCGGPSSSQPETTTQQEDYDSKKPISAGYFAERATVNGFGTNNELQEGDTFKSYYSANFGSQDLCQFMEANTNEEALEMFTAIYDGLKSGEKSEAVVSVSDVDKGRYHKYIQQQKEIYYALVYLENTVLFVSSSIEEQPRYEVFLQDINY